MGASNEGAVYFVSTDGYRTVSKGIARRIRDQLGRRALVVRVFNVGDGEAILLSRGGDGVLFDGGATRRRENAPLGRALLAYLAQERIELRAFVATHPHTDHLNALSTILASDDPPSVARDAVLYHNGEVMPKGLTETLGGRRDALERLRRLQVQIVGGGILDERLSDVEMLHLTDGRWKPKPVYKSVVTAVWFGKASFLFTGDVYDKYEAELLNGPAAGLLRADVLKVTHHGSEHGTSEDFVAAVRPRISLASTADDEGHRLESDIRQRLEAKGVVFDTFTEGGDLVVRTDGTLRPYRDDEGVFYDVRIETPGWLLGGAW